MLTKNLQFSVIAWLDLDLCVDLQKTKNTMKICENAQGRKDTGVNSLELDRPTHEFSLGTSRIQSIYQEPSTPEMPDLSSVTQDICKVCVHPQKN